MPHCAPDGIVAGALQGVLQAGGRLDPSDDGVGIVKEALGFQFTQLLQDQGAGLGQHGGVDVKEPHLPTHASKHDGPALADQAGSDDGGAARRGAGAPQ